ncbi:hypothetical protein TorRG33x02_214180, partial [Trema orientale]
ITFLYDGPNFPVALYLLLTSSARINAKDKNNVPSGENKGKVGFGLHLEQQLFPLTSLAKTQHISKSPASIFKYL